MKYKGGFLPLLAAICFVAATAHILVFQQRPPKAAPLERPPQSTFERGVAGVGLVEPATENISMGVHLPGVVDEVLVIPGVRVAAGAPLFTLDRRQIRAEIATRQAQLALAEAQLSRLRAMPRLEEVAPSTARVNEAQANRKMRADLLKRGEDLAKQGALSAEELVLRQESFNAATALLERAEAEHAMLTAGAWQADLAVAESSVKQARALLDQAETESARHLVTAPKLLDAAGQPLQLDVLQVNVRPGEYVGISPGQTLLVLGDLSRLHVRVDIDEYNIPQFTPGQSARAVLRGDSEQSYALKFVRTEPLVRPKRSLAGGAAERVDTRVLQLVYAVENPNAKLFAGQQLDVFLNGGPAEAP